jgi:hypothetical protein
VVELPPLVPPVPLVPELPLVPLPPGVVAVPLGAVLVPPPGVVVLPAAPGVLSLELVLPVPAVLPGLPVLPVAPVLPPPVLPVLGAVLDELLEGGVPLLDAPVLASFLPQAVNASAATNVASNTEFFMSGPSRLGLIKKVLQIV